eukprot:237824_1
MSKREIITINIGGAGLNIGQCTLEQYCVEQGISPNGIKESKTSHDDATSITFRQSINGKYTARSIFADLSPYTINMIQNFNKYSNIISNDYLVIGKQQAIHYSKGNYTIGKELIDPLLDKIRLMVEECNNFQGIILNNSISGGTGSGVGALCLERLHCNYKKKTRVGIS